MNFFVTPGELKKWIVSLFQDPDIWILAWEIRPSAYSRILQLDDKILLDYESGNISSNIQFFIGNRKLRNPIMRSASHGIERIDFRDSLCIQIVPCFFSRKILLTGSFGTLSPKEYHDIPEEKQFMLWRKAAYRSFKKVLANSSVVTTQLLDNGTVKVWKDIIVSTGALDWFRGGGKLKEFPEGPVEFVPKPLRH